MSYDDDERSVSQNRPIDLYTIVTTTTVYRLTSNETNVAFGGNTFTATTMSRDNLQVTGEAENSELVIHLPIAHPLVQSYAATGIPEQSVMVTLQRLQSVSGVAFQQWTGPAQGLSIDGHVAMIRVPTTTNDALRIQLPVIAAQKQCNHRLGDQRCAPNPGGVFPPGDDPGTGGPDLTALSVSTTIVSIATDGVTLSVGSVGGHLDTWAVFGRVVLANGDSRTIISQVGTTVIIDVPFVFGTLFSAPQIKIEPGCDHSPTTCIAKFNNIRNYGGHPQLNAAVNLWVPNGLGVLQQV